jgi:RimJ/RimL family protein N-acetyltransferase
MSDRGLADGTTSMPAVGALIRDERNRVYARRQSFPGSWDIVGGRVEPGETGEQALARHIERQTGWRLRHIEAAIADRDRAVGGVLGRETDFLVEVDGNLACPRPETGFCWVGPDSLDVLMEGRDGDRRLRDIVARAVRTRLTPRLRLSPLGPWHADDLWRLHNDEGVAAWFGGRRTVAMIADRAARGAEGWERDGVNNWMAYDRGSGELVGRGGLTRMVVEGRSCLEVGWAVRTDLWGRGYATEIGAAGLRFAFAELGADEVVAFTAAVNWRSRAVMERLGMRYTRDIAHAAGLSVLYEITRADQ